MRVDVYHKILNTQPKSISFPWQIDFYSWWMPKHNQPVLQFLMYDFLLDEYEDD